MDIVDELNYISKSLEKIKKDLNEDIKEIDMDMGKFHAQMAKIEKKLTPEEKELLYFVVFINDDLQRNLSNLKNILNRSNNELIQLK